MEAIHGLDFWQDMVKELIVKDNRICGVVTGMGVSISSKSVVLTNGTFLNGLIHIGEKQFGGGRAGESAARGITEQLVQLGFESGRMKTGTPPRLDGRSIDYSKTEIQLGDENPQKFSFTNTPTLTKQLPCHITYTSEQVHDVLRTGFDKSPMFSGRIQGLGPRYCPSIEDKIERFSDRNRHQLFIEPEGWDTHEIYLNGFSSSLPEEVQYKALQLIPGLENVKMFRPGYAIEYDYFPPTQLKLSLETHLISGLFFAGQINGTTGYEEAACQGFMAGINAALKVDESDPFILNRSEAYIGVLIDDLVNKGTEEPYRMFTSRAEYRILLRQDNADLRLSHLAHKIGLQNMEARVNRVNDKMIAIQTIRKKLSELSFLPEDINPYLNGINSAVLDQKTKAIQILARPNVDLASLITLSPTLLKAFQQYDREILEIAEIELKYEGYIKKEKELVDKMERLESLKLIQDFDYSSIKALSNEAKVKLGKLRPHTIGQASRISGVSPADISVLLVHKGR